MWPKIVIAILLVAVGVVTVGVMFSKTSRPQPEIAPATTSDSPPVAAVVPAAVPLPAVSTQSVSGPDVVANDSPTNAAPETHDQYVSRRTDELNELAMQDSPAAHQQIVNELKNPDREVRRAALEALKQADDRSVVPQLQQIADQTDDSGDKAAIQDAIDFINLPSITEYMEQRNAQKAEK